MNVRWMIPTAAVAISLAAIASAQTSTAPATRARTAAAAAPAAIAQASAGVATTVAPGCGTLGRRQRRPGAARAAVTAVASGCRHSTTGATSATGAAPWNGRPVPARDNR